jgi:hypothetical protein
MPALTANRVRGLLIKHLPLHGSFVQDFMRDGECGLLHGKKIAKIQQELQKFGKIDLTGKGTGALQWATMLHEITYINDRAEYMKVFSGHEVSKESIFPVLAGLNNDSIAKALKGVGEFNSALKKGDAPLYPFHHLTAALFAYNILQDELGSDAVIAAQAILLHHERDIKLIPADPAVRLLRDSVKIESLNERSLTENINRNILIYNRLFFDPDIIQEVREEILEGRINPDDQEFDNAGFKLDAFQFTVEFLFPDTNPDRFALPDVVRPYLHRHELFLKFLRVVVEAAENYNESIELRVENLGSLKGLMLFALKNNKYASNVDRIKIGAGAVDGHLAHILKKIEGSIKACPSEEFPSLAELLFMKAKVLDALERIEEGNTIRLQAGIELIKKGDPEAGN